MTNRQKSKSPVSHKDQPLALSVLDLCKRSNVIGPAQSVKNTLELTALADRLGYRRFWIAEHHTDDAAQSAPEVLLPLLASATRTIRVGAGGILLPYYSPLKVAETFLLLETLFPGRIDLGICRGPGVTSPDVARALVYENETELHGAEFAKKAAALVSLLRREPSPAGSDRPIRATPLGAVSPPIWILGAGESSVHLAASLGTSYAYNCVFGGGLSQGTELVAQYHRERTGSAEAQTAIAVSVVCAETQSQAERYDAELIAEGCYRSNIVGTPRQCAEMLTTFAELLGVNEILVVTFVEDPAARRDVYCGLAEQLHLKPPTHARVKSNVG